MGDGQPVAGTAGDEDTCAHCSGWHRTDGLTRCGPAPANQPAPFLL